MDNSSPQTPGHRQLNADEVAKIAKIKALGAEIGLLVDEIAGNKAFDGRAAAIAKTELQTGMMWLTRAVARPLGF